MLVVVLGVLAQFPPATPALNAEPITFPASARVPIDVVGTPALTWSGTSWVVVWRDTRRQPDVAGAAHVYATAWDGGSAPRFPQGLPLPGASPVGATDLKAASTSGFTFMLYSLRQADGGGHLTVVPTLRDAGISGAWAGTVDVSQGEPVRLGSAVLATSGGVAVAGWFVGDEVHLVSVPGMASVRLDAGPDAQSLSLGGIADGGFLVAWVNSSGDAIATTLEATTLTPDDGGLRKVPATVLRAVQALTTASPVLTTQSTGGDWGAWRGPSFTAGTVWPSTVSSFTPMTVATTTSVVSLYRDPNGTFANAAPLGTLTPLAGQRLALVPPLEPAALAAGPNDAMALLLNGPRVFGQPLAIDYNGTTTPTVTPRSPVPLLDAPVRQRAPSVVWVDPERAFLVAWDEEQVDGGSSLMTSWLEPSGLTRGAPRVLLSSPVSEGVRPRLLRRPSGSAWGIQLRVTAALRAISSLVIDGGVVSLGSALPSPRGFGNAVLGDSIDVQWGGATTGSIGFAGDEAMPRFSFANAPAPTCAAAAVGKLWFAGVESNSLKVVQVDDGPVASSMLTTTNSFTGTVSGVCALAASGGSEVFIAWRNNARLLVARTGTALPNPALVATFDPVSGGEPLLVETTAGPVAVWLERASQPPGVGALLARPTETPVLLSGGVDLENLAVASSPAGVAALVWDGFSFATGARRVHARLLGSFDGGVVMPGDGGVVMPSDAGVVTPSDAGVVTPADAGVVAGDAGSADGVPPVTLSFVPACGCQGAPGALLVLLALVVLRLRGARRGARQGWASFAAREMLTP